MAGDWENLASTLWIRVGAILVVGVLLVVGFLVIRHYQPDPVERLSDTSTDVGAPSEELAAAQKEVQEWRQKFLTLKARTDECERALQTERNKTVQDRKRADELAALLETAKARVKQLEGKMASTTPTKAPAIPSPAAGPAVVASPTPTAGTPASSATTPPASSTLSSGPPTAAPSSTASDSGGVAKAVTGFRRLFAAEYPKLAPDSAGRIAKSEPIDLLKDDKAATVLVKWPIEAKGLAFQINETRKDRVAIEQASTDALGQRRVDVFGEALVAGGVLRWKWGAFNANRIDLALLERLVKYARIILGDADGRNLAQVQWVVPQEVAVTLDGPAVKLNGWGAGCETRLVLSPDASGSWAEGEHSGFSLQVKTPGGAAAVVAIRTAADGVEAWAVGGARVAAEGLDKTIAGLQNDCARLEKEIKTMETAISLQKIPELEAITKQIDNVDRKITFIEQVAKMGRRSSSLDSDELDRLKNEKVQLDAAKAKIEKTRLGSRAVLLEKKRADLAAKGSDLVEAQDKKAKLEEHPANPDKAGDFEVQVVTARSNVILAKIKVVCKN